ncbi:glycoside hydrolase family 13 protein [Phycicoccus endophyticus]|uniref:Glycoside hydrolase family 13 protein n=1 Tax=Phycicoccus endophyticus TaxID=1690220 RepID=A0A7G9R1I4_9MICO|nr:glycoside hydrolase family 13 protein [Phycicoccus endophyticus]NHI18754.1 glycoside hydrolase family 13 protein [Phycicoccus endophyticus]QNN49459.1 glycoside hydrolase family 13 protein [Phycicoccus endophyticus]GGL36774.1 alpha-glucosidase [Phycicoccus endophyticus]
MPSRTSSTDPLARDAEWWRGAVIYQVYPRSFADSDGDGVGDLPGVTARLGHLVDLGVDAVWLSPFYRSPQADAGYDVSDHCDVDPLFGTLADVDELVDTAHGMGLRVIVDLVPNHTSDEHPWFRAALAGGPGSAARARYLFRDGRGPEGGQPPNNWRSVFSGPAWTRVTEPDGSPGQWYLHLFDSTQPDLDWSNPDVHAAFERILHFWLQRGVDGFRVDVARGLVKAAGLPDHPPELQLSSREAPDGTRSPLFDQPGVHDVYRRWRTVLDGYPGRRILVAEAHVEPPERLARYVRPDEMHQAFNFEFLDTPYDAAAVRSVVERSYAAYGAVGATTTWVLNNHDDVRHVSRFGLPVGTPTDGGIGPRDPQPDLVVGARRARAASMLMLALPGCAYLYQGEELGLPEHTTIPDEDRQDPTFARSGGTLAGRDGARVPIPWAADAPAYGFSPNGRSWLPQPATWGPYAVDVQHEDPASTLALYRRALRLRRTHRLGTGELVWLEDPNPAVVTFGVGDVVVRSNFGESPVPLPDVPVLLSSDPVREGHLPGYATAWLAKSPPEAESVVSPS